MPEPEEGPGEGKQRMMGWLETWAIARHDLGLSDCEWLSMTPRMVQALLWQRLEGLRERELQLAIVAADIVNTNACRFKKSRTPKHYMLHPWPAKRGPFTGEELLKVWPSK
jgi:hypothetical protein